MCQVSPVSPVCSVHLQPPPAPSAVPRLHAFSRSLPSVQRVDHDANQREARNPNLPLLAISSPLAISAAFWERARTGERLLGAPRFPNAARWVVSLPRGASGRGARWDAEGWDGRDVTRDHQPKSKTGLCLRVRRRVRERRRERGSAFFFFALPLQDGADADAHGAVFTQRRFLEAVFVAARPQEQTGTGRGALEVAFTEVAIETL